MSGLGPSPRAPREYKPRMEPIIRPFKVPRQEMMTNTKSNVPATWPKTCEKAKRALCSPLCIKTEEGTMPARPI